MKFLAILLLALLAISSASANYQCGRFACLPGHSCICDKGIFRCVYECNDLQIVQTVVNRWTDGAEGPSVQVQVQIINHSGVSIKDLVMASAVKLNANQIWGVDKCTFDNGITIMDLPNYQNGIANGSSYSFGYVAKGDKAAHLYVQKVYLM
ncbi:hypothetical protein DICPUDRAFT_36696 [Dictyostelium purpureum]|uniref:Carbohydrate binding domain-containing protein n=1 Tax=Dictyostelium purpureum TaxID=5786 RepID=F0ZRI2_DICPU|nr:uncharacterized protein DICPUDRAFT_36696 [Dictyostelium purpureum]EGC33446.1 hypothetical protein DICPUDRAFT_36696 [Dictyostelium purpureum]|eukprot:XP_003290017.1 hypothetical protein DICPUDRAFT_36696 [Dictyostelium purpureum]